MCVRDGRPCLTIAGAEPSRCAAGRARATRNRACLACRRVQRVTGDAAAVTGTTSMSGLTVDAAWPACQPHSHPRGLRSPPTLGCPYPSTVTAARGEVSHPARSYEAPHGRSTAVSFAPA